jgi:hypothetical protein
LKHELRKEIKEAWGEVREENKQVIAIRYLFCRTDYYRAFGPHNYSTVENINKAETKIIFKV